MEPKEKKLNVQLPFRGTFRGWNLDCCRHTARGLELAWARAPCPVLSAAHVQHHVAFLYLESQNAPSESPRESSGWRGEAGSLDRTGALVSSTPSLWLCVCEYPGVLSPTLHSLVPWLTWTNKPVILKSPTFSHPHLPREGLFLSPEQRTPCNRWVFTWHKVSRLLG